MQLITSSMDYFLGTNFEKDLNADLFRNIGIDSLKFAELIAHLEDELGVRIDFACLTDWEEIKTLNGLAKFVLNHYE